MFTFTKTATTDLRQADRPTTDSLEVNLQLPLRWRHAYGRKYYADVVNRFQFGRSSYNSVMHTAPGDHHVQVWSQSGHMPARRSDFRSSTKVPISRDLWPWPWPWPWAHAGCAPTWRPLLCRCGRDRAIFGVVEAICVKSLQTDRRTDRRRTPRDCISSTEARGMS